MQAVDLWDDLVMGKRKSGIRVSCDNPDCPADETNLAYQAASLVLKQVKTNQGVDIRIKKKIPISAGLGGGSSNAAVTLQGINKLYQLQLSDKALNALACRIGSDVPFFLYSGQALVKERGEVIQPLSLFKDYWLVLVCPSFEISTKWAYQNVKISLTKKIKGLNLKNLENRFGFFKALRSFGNDLEEVVSKKYPIIRKIKENLESFGALKSSMSGSGPTVYGVFDRKPQAEEVARKLLRGDWQVFLTQPIPVTFRSFRTNPSH
jgi:4-diphosphocytidyl-2-C-methyl-D-erythritol kinase